VTIIRGHGIQTQADQQISHLNKGLGKFVEPMSREDIVHLGWNLLREDLSLPSAVLYRDRIEHNLAWMQRFMDAYKIRLAPHGKTTMAPRLFQMQIDGGAWGITLASAHQAMVAHAHGIRRVLMANQLVGKQNLQIIAELLGDANFEFYCLVDSVAGVDLLGEFFSARGLRLRVLLELGVMGGRCGIRDDQQLQAVSNALTRWSETVQLCGVELYEGVLKDEANIRKFMQRACEVTRNLLEQKRFARQPAILSGAGSAWYDVVAEEFSAAKLGEAVEIVLRPGCYLTHDVGNYEMQQKRILESNPIAREMRSGLVPALHVWTYIQSIPEPELAIVQLGRRDAAFDSGLPTPALHFRPGNEIPTPTPAHWETTKMMDQHAYLKIAAGDDASVGDMVGFNISHPCLTFDKWRTLPVLDEHYNVVDIAQTYF
jgi:D-serine deaminase-like pyridoxal phosphate-dependent protein